jgi:hypothetical protein
VAFCVDGSRGLKKYSRLKPLGGGVGLPLRVLTISEEVVGEEEAEAEDVATLGLRTVRSFGRGPGEGNGLSVEEKEADLEKCDVCGDHEDCIALWPPSSETSGGHGHEEWRELW